MVVAFLCGKLLDTEVDIYADQIHQSERPHWVSEAYFSCAINVFDRCVAFFIQVQGFTTNGHENTIYDKTENLFCYMQRSLTKRFCKFHRTIYGGLSSVFSADHLYQGHL